MTSELLLIENIRAGMSKYTVKTTEPSAVSIADIFGNMFKWTSSLYKLGNWYMCGTSNDDNLVVAFASQRSAAGILWNVLVNMMIDDLKLQHQSHQTGSTKKYRNGYVSNPYIIPDKEMYQLDADINPESVGFRIGEHIGFNSSHPNNVERIVTNIIDGGGVQTRNDIQDAITDTYGCETLDDMFKLIAVDPVTFVHTPIHRDKFIANNDINARVEIIDMYIKEYAESIVQGSEYVI